jgi:RsiW-degrading membrane proteinase PrsW (M82 family)
MEWTVPEIVHRAFRYTAIALAAFVAIVLFVVLTHGAEVPFHWVFLGLFTSGLFWITVKQSREYWRHPGFWVVMGALLGLHLVIFVSILRVYPDWRPLWFVPTITIEAGLFGALLFLLFGRRKRS